MREYSAIIERARQCGVTVRWLSSPLTMFGQMRLLESRSIVVRAVMLVLLATPPAFGQAGVTTTRTDSLKPPRPLFEFRDLVVAGAFVGGTIAAFPLDKRLAHHLENPGAQANKFFGHAATGLEEFTSPGAYFIGGGLYLVGR